MGSDIFLGKGSEGGEGGGVGYSKVLGSKVRGPGLL